MDSLRNGTHYALHPLGGGKRLPQPAESLPRHPTVPRTLVQSLVPSSFDFVSEALQHLSIAGDSVIGMVALEFAAWIPAVQCAGLERGTRGVELGESGVEHQASVTAAGGVRSPARAGEAWSESPTSGVLPDISGPSHVPCASIVHSGVPALRLIPASILTRPSVRVS